MHCPTFLAPSARALWAGLLAAVLAGPATAARPAADWAACLQALRQELPPELRAETFEQHARDVADLREPIRQATASQPEFRLAVWDYLARLVDDQREADGREVLAREAEALASIAARHGVDAATVVAVFGVETDYGRVAGRHPVLAATLSRACLDLDSRERRRHFYAALWLLQEGLVPAGDFRGSWAGAFGLTQFMPGTFVEHMDDGDGSGRVDILHSVPDALGTTANYLRRLGWDSTLPWGLEVRPDAALAARWNALERDHACLGAGAPAGLCRRWADWAASGLRRADGAELPTLPPDTLAALLMPAGYDGPAWLVTRNYQAAWQYNRADAYALAIGLLADRLRGDPPPQRPWPTDDPALSRSAFVELQTLLQRRGHCEVEPDGRDGPRTRAAVAEQQRALDLPVTGRAGATLLQALRDALAAVEVGEGGDGAPTCLPARTP